MILGSDVSHWRPVLDYSKYKASGRKFLLFKATDFKDGKWFVDPTYAVNRNGANAVGLVPGAYLFLRAGLSGREQANHYLRTIGDHRGLILVVDFEHADTGNPTPQQLSEAVQTIYAATGRWPWVYTNRGYWNSVGNPQRPGLCPLWHAEWRSGTYGPMYGGWSKPLCWQYTDRKSVPGVQGTCDDNQFFGTEQELREHAFTEVDDMADASSRGWGPPCPSGSIVSIRVDNRQFNVHKRVAKIFEAFLRELVMRGYSLDGGQLDDWSYVCRHISNDPSKPWSNHAWGLAIDVNSLTNPMKRPLTTNMPSWVRNADYLMRKYGLRWGGAYVNSTPDPMHFEFMLTPADADRISKELGDVMTEEQMQELKSFIAQQARFVARWTDHGDEERPGTGNHLERVRGDVAEVKAEATSAKAAVGQVLAEMSAIRALVEQIIVGTGADPEALVRAGLSSLLEE